MNRPVIRAGPHTLDGAVLTLLAESLLLPTGLVTSALLTRRLDADGFGLFTLAVATVTWIEWTIVTVFARATIKLIGDAEDWRPLGGAVTRVMTLTGCGAALLLWLLAEPLALLLAEPRMTGLLRLFALDLPFFCLGQAHRQILIGLGRFPQRAGATAARWLSRMVLIVALVQLGFGVWGAVAGNIGATLIELIVERWYVRPPLLRHAPFQLGQFWQYSAPLFLSAISLRFYDRLDLFALKVLGGTADQAGLYGAAQRLALVPSFLGLTLSPLLLSTISRMLRDGGGRRAAQLGYHAIRAVLCLVPLAAIAAGASGEIVTFVFGPRFLAAAPLLGRLVFAVLALLLISISTSILTAHGRPRVVLALCGPLLPLAILGHYLLIPRLGPPGAALVTLTVASLGALVSTLTAHRLAGVALPVATLMRSLAASGLSYALAALWPAAGLLLAIKLPAIALAAALTLAVLGEFSVEEAALVWSYVQRPLRVVFGQKAREI